MFASSVGQMSCAVQVRVYLNVDMQLKTSFSKLESSTFVCIN